MCGRFDQHTLPYRYAGYIDALLRTTPNDPPQRYNVAPQTYAWVGRTTRDGARELVPLLWGLVPYWVQDPKKSARPINARSEDVATKPMFRNLIGTRRCVIPVDGFYEWQVTLSGKQPHYVRRADGAPMLLAGLWDRWRHGEMPIESFTILTSDANTAVARLHDRMPAIIDAADLARWLDVRGTDAGTARAMLKPYRTDAIETYPVSRAVNTSTNEGPTLIEPEPKLV
jgi:putative SOS response-associated peptidase YedK